MIRDYPSIKCIQWKVLIHKEFIKINVILIKIKIINHFRLKYFIRLNLKKILKKIIWAFKEAKNGWKIKYNEEIIYL